MEGRDLVIFEERVQINKGDWMMLTRMPNINDEEL